VVGEMFKLFKLCFGGKDKKKPQQPSTKEHAAPPSTGAVPAPIGADFDGKVLKVTDGDTVRIKPTNANDSILLRIAGIDAPETAHHGNPGQPFSHEAQTHLQSLVQGHVVHVRHVTTDQYGRSLGIVYLADGRDVGFLMVTAGLAVAYTGAGAQFGPAGKRGYVQAQQNARNARLGMWSQDHVELPGDYKRRIKNQSGGNGNGAHGGPPSRI
jgi:endonuclease YncB( thermonuclease family)